MPQHQDCDGNREERGETDKDAVVIGSQFQASRGDDDQRGHYGMDAEIDQADCDSDQQVDHRPITPSCRLERPATMSGPWRRARGAPGWTLWPPR